jgi:hypothetical protein
MHQGADGREVARRCNAVQDHFLAMNADDRSEASGTEQKAVFAKSSWARLCYRRDGAGPCTMVVVVVVMIDGRPLCESTLLFPFTNFSPTARQSQWMKRRPSRSRKTCNQRVASCSMRAVAFLRPRLEQQSSARALA